MNRFETAQGLILVADIREGLAKLHDDSIDAVVTDPPYEMGFMGKKWDGTGIAYQVDVWQEVMRVLKPGGHLLAFGGVRTHHRLMVALEDAGFEMRDVLMWIFGQGFPKSLDILKALAEMENAALNGSRQWEGWGTALRPSYEPIIMVRKLKSEPTIALNILTWGTGGLYIDGCRLDVAPSDSLHAKNPHTQGGFGHAGAQVYGKSKGAPKYDTSKGRWPPNVMFECICEGPVHTDPRCLGAVIDAEAQAARFFYCPKASRSEREEGLEALPPVESAKNLGRKEGSAGLNNPRAGAGRTQKEVRNPHPTVKPLALMRWLVRLVTPPEGLVLDPFCGSGSTLVAAVQEGHEFLGIDLEEPYCEIAAHRVRYWEGKHGVQKD